ncbi:GreA/GreB family elongation factor [Pseudomonas sp. BIGb0427]|nr:hypothetical protein [Pseudomonas sp. BIGb0427]QPG63827.1 GreA/GreB family elongation factor [Pseudomonas sp. BIGb0427]
MGHSQHRDFDSNLASYQQLAVPGKLVPGYRCRLTSRPLPRVVSYLAPVAKILIYKGVGDEIKLPVADRRVAYEITAIWKSPNLV